MPNLFELGGGAGIGSYIVVFRDGRLAEETKLLKLRGAYESGEQIYFSVMDEQTKDALVPASGWIDEEGYLHLVARDFDDNKTYSVVLGDAPAESEIEVEYAVEDGIEAGGEPLGGAVSVSGTHLVIPEGEAGAELPDYVDAIEQGNAILPLKDERLPEAAAADADKVIKVNAEGQFELGEVEGGVTEERVQQMIDAAIGDAISASY